MRTFYTLLSCSILSVLVSQVQPKVQAQEIIYDSVTLGEGNANMSFYSIANGELMQVPLADWHLALDVRPMGSTARINGGMGLKLFRYGSLAEWDEVNLDTWIPNEQYRNNQTDWSDAAFSQGGDGMFDLGWGVYDVVTHIVSSDVMYLVQLPDESWKKVALLSLANGVYELQFANLDGTDSFNISIDKADYEGQLFAYCNLVSGTVENLEPSEPWDIVFFTYEDEVAPGNYYPVTGGLIHPNVTVQQSEGLDDPFLDGSYSFDSFSLETNVIGHDWKTYVPMEGYAIESNRCYFVTDSYGDIWRLVFTGFGGSATGEITFGLLEEGAVDVAEAKGNHWRIFPNPISSNQALVIEADGAKYVRIFNASGSLVIEQQLTGSHRLTLPQLTSGLYIVQLTDGDGARQTQSLMIQ